MREAVPIVDTHLASSLESVNLAESIVLSSTQSLGWSEDAQFDLALAVREAMVNAVKHGNDYHPNKTVHFKVVNQGDGLLVHIEDQGNGFLADQVADPTRNANLLRDSGRGLLIIRTYVDTLDIAHSPSGGTAMSLFKKNPA